MRTALSTSMSSAETLARVSATGRWNGRVTRRVLPAIEVDLDPTQRAEVARIWLTQAATEFRVAGSFACVETSLRTLNADAGLIALAARAVDDEHRHAALCEDVAGRLMGRVVGPHARLPRQRPEHAGAPDGLRRVLWVVGQCCFNETFASAYLSVASEGAETPLIARAVRELLSDEVDHARLGWAFMQTLSAELRRGLEEWLVPLAIQNLREWRHIELPHDERLAAHGIPPMDAAQHALTDALVGVIIPGFRHIGLDTRALERWAAGGAPVGSLP